MPTERRGSQRVRPVSHISILSGYVIFCPPHSKLIASFSSVNSIIYIEGTDHGKPSTASRSHDSIDAQRCSSSGQIDLQSIV